MLKFRFKNLFFLFLIIIGIILRFWCLGSQPAFHTDELNFAYNAYSLLKTGADEYGQKWPIILKSAGDNKLALQSYVLAPVVGVFGLKESVIRWPSAIFGLTSVGLTYLIALLLFKSKKVSFYAALFLLLSPWHILFSRTNNEAVLQLFLILSFIWLFLKNRETKKTIYKIIVPGVLLLSLFSYYSSFVFLPLFLFYLTVIYSKKRNLKKFWPLALCIASVGLFFLTQPLARIQQTSLFKSDAFRSRIFVNYSEETGNIFISRVFNNKLIVGSVMFLENYFKHFSLYWLVFENFDYNRYSIPSMGGVYFFQAVFLLIGAYLVVKHLKKSNYQLLFIWFFMAFLPLGVSSPGLGLQRGIIAVPAISIISALGFYGFSKSVKKISKPKKNLIWVAMVFVIIFHISFFANRYFIHQSKRQPWRRQSYGKDFITELNTLSKQYSNVIVSEAPPVLFMFYNKVDPHKAQEYMLKISTLQQGVTMLNQFGNMIFYPGGCPRAGKLNTLYVCHGQDVPYNSKILKVIRYPGGLPARIFLEFVDPENAQKQDLPYRVNYISETIKNPQIIEKDAQNFW